MAHYKSDGMEWEEGEIPKCSYCGKTAEEIELQETCINGDIVCEADECRLKLAEECCVSEVELEEEDEDE